MNTMPTTQLDQAAKALHLAATTLEELHAAATAALLPTNPANGMPLTEDEKADAIRQRRSPAMSPAAWAEYRQATAAPGHHTTQAMKEMGIEPGPQPPLGGWVAPSEVDKLKNERDALGRILLRLGDEVHSFSFETVEAAAQRNTKHGQAFREIATFLDVENNTTTEELKNRIIEAIHEGRKAQEALVLTVRAAGWPAITDPAQLPEIIANMRKEIERRPPPAAAPAPEDPANTKFIDGRLIAITALERIAAAKGAKQGGATAVAGLEICETTLRKMRGPDSCTREDLAWGLNSLHTLACLGNGNRWGNSWVNAAAQDAIRRIRETNPEAVPCNLATPIAAGYARPNDRGPSPEPPAKPLHSRWDEAETEPPAPAPEPGPIRMTRSEMEMNLESAWGLIANAYGGDWNSAGKQWREAAEAWRELVLRRLPGWSATGKEE